MSKNGNDTRLRGGLRGLRARRHGERSMLEARQRRQGANFAVGRWFEKSRHRKNADRGGGHAAFGGNCGVAKRQADFGYKSRARDVQPRGGRTHQLAYFRPSRTNPRIPVIAWRRRCHAVAVPQQPKIVGMCKRRGESAQSGVDVLAHSAPNTFGRL